MQKLIQAILLFAGWIFLVLCFVAGQAFGQNTGDLMPDFVPTFLNANGTGPASSGFVCTLVSGTSTPLATYSDTALTVTNQNPIRLNAAGRPVLGATVISVYLTASSYTMAVYAAGTGNTCNGTTVGTLIRSVDGVYNRDQLLAAGGVTATKILTNRLGVGSDVEAQRMATFGGIWTGTVDAHAIGVTATLRPVGWNNNAAGIHVSPVMVSAAAFSAGYLEAIETAPSFQTSGGVGLANRIVTGLHVRNVNIPAAILAPFDGTNGVAHAIFAQAPTEASLDTNYTYGIGTTGKLGLIGSAPILFEPTVANPVARIARSTGTNIFINGSSLDDLTINSLGRAILISTHTTGQYARISVTSAGVISFANDTGSNGTTAFQFDPRGIGNVGSFAFGASGTSSLTPFFVNMTATAHAANTSFYRAYISNTGAITIPAGTAPEVATLTLEEPNISATGTVTDAYTQIIKAAPTEGTRNGSLWVAAGLTRLSGGLLVNVTAASGTAITSSGTVVMASITSASTGDYMCYNTALSEVTQGTATCTVSSARYKHDIQYDGIPGLGLVMKLRPIQFVSNIHPELGHQFGFTAEDVNTVEKRLIYYDSQGRPNGFAYENYTAILTRAVQEQQRQIDQLRGRVYQLERR